MERERFVDKIALVTGGANGLGRGMVEQLVKEGAQVAIFDIEDDTVTPLSNASATSGPSTPTTITAANITDASAVGRSILTASDAAAARTAIGAGISSFDGSYNSLKDKPTIPPAYTLPAATANALGGVKQVTLASSATAADIVTALKTAGVAK